MLPIAKELGCPHCGETNADNLILQDDEKSALCVTCNRTYKFLTTGEITRARLLANPYKIGVVLSVLEFNTDFKNDDMNPENYDKVVELVREWFIKMSTASNEDISNMIETTLDNT